MSTIKQQRILLKNPNKIIHLNFIYDEVMEEWLAPYGYAGNTPLGFAEGNSLAELYRDTQDRVEELERSQKEKLTLVLGFDKSETPVDRQNEALAFIALTNL